MVSAACNALELRNLGCVVWRIARGLFGYAAGQVLLWDLMDVRERAIPWCGGMAFFCLLAAYAGGTLMSRWQKQVRKAQRALESGR